MFLSSQPKESQVTNKKKDTPTPSSLNDNVCASSCREKGGGRGKSSDMSTPLAPFLLLVRMIRRKTKLANPYDVTERINNGNE